jgi:hypothetical protein
MMQRPDRLCASLCLAVAGALAWTKPAAAEPPESTVEPAPAEDAAVEKAPPADAKADAKADEPEAKKGDCKLELVVDRSTLAKVKLSVDGERVAPAPDGIAVDTLPGRHVVTAVLGLRKVDYVTHLEPGQTKTLRVSLPKTAPLAPLSLLPPPSAEQDGVPYSSDAWQRSAGLVVGGAGVVGLGVAGAFFANAMHKKAEAAKACSGPVPCEPKVRQTLDAKAAESSNIAAVAAATGFALAGVGAVLFITAPRPPGMKELRFSPTFASGGGGISAKATF